MHQDGSDEKVSSGGAYTTDVEMSASDNVLFVATRGATTIGDTLPFVMSLRLLDPDDTPITSQFAPFAQSYNVSRRLDDSNVSLGGHIYLPARLGGSFICPQHIREKSPG